MVVWQSAVPVCCRQRSLSFEYVAAPRVKLEPQLAGVYHRIRDNPEVSNLSKVAFGGIPLQIHLFRQSNIQVGNISVFQMQVPVSTIRLDR